MNRLMANAAVCLALCTLIGWLVFTGGTPETRLQAEEPKKDARPDWRELNAYSLGVQAYLYAFPWAYMPDARLLRTENINRQANRFDHVRKLEDAAHLSGGAPNNDTLYSRVRGSTSKMSQ